MGRNSRARRLAHGLAAGVLFSCLRAPLGLDWTQVAVVQGSTRTLFRALALIALALALDPARPALRGGPGAGWLAALCGGFLLHGLVLDVTPGSRAGYVLTVLAGTLLLRALAGPRARSEEPAPEAPSGGERAGLFTVGLGSALALETLAHEVRLFTLATSADDTVVAGVHLALIAVGAAAFGPLFARLGREHVRLAAGLAASAAATVGGLAFLRVLAADGLHGYLRSLDPVFDVLRTIDGKLGGHLGIAALPSLDGASIGTLWTTAILAAAALIGPGFVLGAALGATRNAGRLAPALLGAAAGLIALPFLIRARGAPLDADELDGASLAWELTLAGTSAAAAGVALVAFTGPAPRAGGCLLALAIALVPWIRPRLVLWSLSPWSPRQVLPELVWPTAEGLLTVEPAAREGRLVLTLDRERLTPVAEEEVADERRLRLAWSLVPEERRTGTVRALLVGQITPQRALVLASLGALELDRTAPWHAAMPAVEERLFRGGPAPPGRIVAPAEARAKLGDGEYDWVVAAPAFGPIVSWKTEAREIWGSPDAPRLTELELPRGTLGVAWIAGTALVPRRVSLEPLILTVESLESFSAGLVRGLELGPGSPAGPTFRIPRHPGPVPAAFLGTMPQMRPFLVQAAWTANLACEAAPELARGLALHFAAQELSSPYETRAQQVEIDDDALRAFFAAVPEPGALDPLTRDLWEALGWLFTEKRMPEQALVYIEPLADRFAPWPELDRAVARAYAEVLEPETAGRFLERARKARPEDVEILLESARCAEALGEFGASVGFLERALTLRPGRPDLERAVALAMVRGGDPRGPMHVERLLAENPRDPELLEALGRPPPAQPPELDQEE
jgi:hypothetical protein